MKKILKLFYVSAILYLSVIVFGLFTAHGEVRRILVALFVCCIPVIVIVMLVTCIKVGKHRADSVIFLTQGVFFDNYDKNAPEREFDFTCEYCGGKVHSTEKTCSHCGAVAYRNREYLAKKAKNDADYLAHLDQEKNNLMEEARRIEKRIRYAENQKVMKKWYFDFENQDGPEYMPAMKFDFDCPYCGAHVSVKRGAKYPVCPNCGADANDSSDYRIAVQRDALERLRYDEYERLRAIMTDFNNSVRPDHL